ncbi:hypothetical protein ACSS6W_005948 [Trichoderma asperelloides]
MFPPHLTSILPFSISIVMSKKRYCAGKTASTPEVIPMPPARPTVLKARTPAEA